MSDLVLGAFVVLTFLVTGWLAFTATRLDRLHVRLDAAYASLDVALIRRCAAVAHLADTARSELGPQRADRLAAAAVAGRRASDIDRVRVENAVTRAIGELGDLRRTLPPRLDNAVEQIAESSDRVLLARRFYNDAVRDTRNLRTRRRVRWFALAGHRALPEFFDIDDSTAAVPSLPRGRSTVPDASKGT